jgi:hypothetical protein
MACTRISDEMKAYAETARCGVAYDLVSGRRLYAQQAAAIGLRSTAYELGIANEISP